MELTDVSIDAICRIFGKTKTNKMMFITEDLVLVFRQEKGYGN